MEIYRQLSEIFWDEQFWLKENVTWADFKNSDTNTVRHPEPCELFMAIPVALLFLLSRLVLEKRVMKYIGQRLNVKSKKFREAENIPELQKSFGNSENLTQDEIRRLMEKLNLEERQVQRWFRIRRNQRKSSAMTKFCEGGWRLTFHFTSFCYGIYVLHDEDFFTDLDLILDMETWPHHHVKPEFYNYYMLTLGFWISVVLSLFSDVRRKDFKMMAFHHAMTCSLMVTSWFMNYVRLGMTVLLIHDFADIFLETCKMCKYARREFLANCIFVVFYISWIWTRLYIYPNVLYVIYVKYVEHYQRGGRHYFATLMMTCFMIGLQVLHVIWTFLIARVLFDLVVIKVANDHRSESEAEDSESVDSCHGNGNQGEANGNLANKNDHSNGTSARTNKLD